MDDFIVGRRDVPWAICLYGVPGIGKSTLAAHELLKSIFANLEDGLERIECTRTPHLKQYSELRDWLRKIYETDCKTVVIDTLDALENLLSAEALKKFNNEHNKNFVTLSEIPYGRGSEILKESYIEFLDLIDKFKSAGKNVLLLSHEKIEKFEDPSADSYDRYTININKKCAPLVIGRLDGVFFANYDKHVKSRGNDFGNDKKRAIGTGRRLLHCVESPSYIAKNRFGLPETVDMSPEIFSMLDQGGN